MSNDPHNPITRRRLLQSAGMLVMISHEGLEEWGMEACAEWLAPLVPEVKVQWIATGDPFQVPAVRA